jgi:uncharacterized protein YdaU (DUF1376 family)
MAAEKAPAFQFYPNDFLTDGNVAGMSLQERGAYITLICICWKERTLPLDISRLANMVGLPRRQFARIWPNIEPCFRQSGALLVHPRLEKEREKQDAFRRRQSDKGKASAANRAATEAQPDGNHGSTEPQPEVNSALSDLRSSSSISGSARTQAAAKTPRHRPPADDPNDNVRIITKLAHEAIDIEGVNARLPVLTEAVKSLCACRDIAYDSRVVAKAIDSALVQRQVTA